MWVPPGWMPFITHAVVPLSKEDRAAKQLDLQAKAGKSVAKPELVEDTVAHTLWVSCVTKEDLANMKGVQWSP